MLEGPTLLQCRVQSNEQLQMYIQDGQCRLVMAVNSGTLQAAQSSYSQRQRLVIALNQSLLFTCIPGQLCLGSYYHLRNSPAVCRAKHFPSAIFVSEAVFEVHKTFEETIQLCTSVTHRFSACTCQRFPRAPHVLRQITFMCGMLICALFADSRHNLCGRVRPDWTALSNW